MKQFSLLSLPLIAALAILAPSSLSAQIINIDFLSQRGSESVAPNYVGQGAAGGGNTFNGLAADNSASTDIINVSGTDLLDSNGAGTTVGFSISNVGADNSGDPNAGILNGAYLFLNSANNNLGSVPFTISGLTTPTADLYFYTANISGLANPTITFTSGATSTPFTDTGIFTSSNTVEFLNVPVSGGEITGNYGAGAVVVFGGMTIEETPEPATWAMMGLGVLVLVWAVRRRRSMI